MLGLAGALSNSGRTRDAIPLGEQVVALRRKHLGPEHSDTLWAMNNLGLWLKEVGRTNEGHQMLEAALTAYRKVRGLESPGTLSTMNNFANSLAESGRLEEALKLREEILPLRRKVNGPRHPDTLKAMSNLANSLADMGRHVESLQLREETLTLKRKVLGPEHPDTLVEMGNKVAALQESGRREEALELIQQVHLLMRKALSPEHPTTLWALSRIVVVLDELGRPAEALRHQKEYLALLLKSDHFQSSDYDVLSQMAENSYRQQDYQRAEVFYREVMAHRRQRPGAEQSDKFIGPMGSLGRTLCDWAWAERATNASAAWPRAREGESLLRQALALRTRQTNVEPWRVTELTNRFGGALCVTAFLDPPSPPPRANRSCWKPRSSYRRARPSSMRPPRPRANTVATPLNDSYACTKRGTSPRSWHRGRKSWPRSNQPRRRKASESDDECVREAARRARDTTWLSQKPTSGTSAATIPGGRSPSGCVQGT
jgi:tetratricopeptide (TPR) repeat protein